VIGLPEGDWLEVRGAEVTLRGEFPAYLFRNGRSVEELRQDYRIVQGLQEKCPFL
jgi:hypothetical protein